MVKSEIEKELTVAMSGVGVKLSSDMLSKCVAISRNHNLSASLIATTWEVHSLNSNMEKLTSKTFPSFRTALFSTISSSSNTATNTEIHDITTVSPTPIKKGAVISRPAMGKRTHPASTSSVASTPPNRSTKRRVEFHDSQLEHISNPKSNVTSSPLASSSIGSAIVTPAKQQSQQPQPQQQQQEKKKQQTPAYDYGNRKNSGEVLTIFNPNKLPSIASSATSTSLHHGVQINQPFGLVQPYKHMTDKDRSKALDSHSQSFQPKIIQQMQKEHLKLLHPKNEQEENDDDLEQEEDVQVELVGIPHPTTQLNIGRVCNSAHEGKMNKTTILLEGSKNGSNGARIELDVNHFHRNDDAATQQQQQQQNQSSYSLFPGQIVGVSGVNNSGRKMYVQELKEGVQETQFAKIKKSELKHLYDTANTGTDTITDTSTDDDDRTDASSSKNNHGMKVYAVAGPYTTNQDLNYAPLTDLILLVLEEKPDVVIMMGPFVDMRQQLLKDGDEVKLEYEQDGDEDVGEVVRRYVSYETLFAAKISQVLEDLYTEVPDLKTKFILVPSLDDAIAEPVYPQPPLEDSLPNGGKVIRSIPETQEIPFGSLCLDAIETAGGRKVPKNKANRRVHLVSNPSTIQVNEVTIGFTSTDALLHLSSGEINHKLQPGTRICRLAEHFIQQQSYYPMFPPPSLPGMEVNLDVNKRTEYSMPVQPDILLLPSKLACLSKDIAGGTVFVNPGHLVKGSMGGSFAVMDIHPMKMEKVEVSSSENDEEVETDVKDRIRVEIRRI